MLFVSRGTRGDWDGWFRRGILRSNTAKFRMNNGGDSLPIWLSAEEDFTRALAVNPKLASALVERAEIRWNRGILRQKAGDRDQARKRFEDAVTD